MAARLLDLVGITCNRNTIPGDDSAARPSGIRLGTPWITQRGFKEQEIDRLAEIIAMVLKSAKPFSYDGKGGKPDARAKLDFETMTNARRAVDDLTEKAGRDYELPLVGKTMPDVARSHFGAWPADLDQTGPGVIELSGAEPQPFLPYPLPSAANS